MRRDDCYTLLDVRPGATAEELKRAYRDLTKCGTPTALPPTRRSGGRRRRSSTPSRLTRRSSARALRTMRNQGRTPRRGGPAAGGPEPHLRPDLPRGRRLHPAAPPDAGRVAAVLHGVRVHHGHALVTPVTAAGADADAATRVCGCRTPATRWMAAYHLPIRTLS